MATRQRRHAALLIAAFFVLGFVALVHHEPWRDEFEYWEAARTSDSLVELRASTRYLGQPPLWSYCLYGLTRVTSNWHAMQYLNLAFATSAIAVLALWGPFPWWQKWLLAFGYFPLFEYGTISRYYGLGLLLLFAWCASASWPGQVPLWRALWLSLLAVVHFHGTLTAIATLLAALLGAALEGRRLRPREWAGAALASAAIGFAIGIAIPPADSHLLQPFRFFFDSQRLVVSLARLWRGYAPWPPTLDTFWNRNALDAFPAAQAALGLALFALFAWSLRGRRAAFLYFAGVSAALFLFVYTQRLGQVRHDGMFFLALVAGLWLALARGGPLPRHVTLVFGGVLGVHLAAGLFATAQDLRLPFSQGGPVAEALRAPELAALPIIADVDFTTVPVASRLERPVFLLSQGRFGTHVVWNRERRSVTRADLEAAVRRLRRGGAPDVVLLLNYILEPRDPYEAMGCYEGAIVANETYCLYRTRWPRRDIPPGAP